MRRRSWAHSFGAFGFLLAAVLAVLCWQSVPAAAHAVVAGLVPATESHPSTRPERVELHVAQKAATGEGDPLQVFAPTGDRIDRGDLQLSNRGDVLFVTLDPRKGPANGRFYVLYQVVSADTHVVTGRSEFTVEETGSGQSLNTRTTVAEPATQSVLTSAAAVSPRRDPDLALLLGCGVILLVPRLLRRRDFAATRGLRRSRPRR